MRPLSSAVLLLVPLTVIAQADLLATQKGTAVPSGAWTKLPYVYSAGVIPQSNAYAVTGFDKAFYVPAIDRMCNLGNFREPSSEPNRAWLCYSFAENDIVIVDVGSTFHDEHMPEGGHPVGVVNIDPATSIAYGPCCFSGSAVSDAPCGGAYFYDFVGNVGRNRQSPSRLAWYTQQATGAVDPVTGMLVAVGGQNGVQTTSVYNPAANVWDINIKTNGTAPPPGIMEASMTWDSADGKLYLFGGRNGESISNAVYRFDVPTNTWEKLLTSGHSPPARYAAGWAYSAADNAFLAYSGYDAKDAILNDTWMFDVGTATWTQVAANGPQLTSPPFERVAYFSGDDVFVAFNATTAGPELFGFRWRSSGTKAGYRTITRPHVGNSLNRNVTGIPTWARAGGIAADESSVYIAWNETGGPSDRSEAMWLRPYVVAWNGERGAEQLGSGYATLSAGSGLESMDVSIAVVDKTPWACWHEQGVSTAAQIQCKGWTIGSWNLGGLIGRVGNAVAQGQPQVAAVNSTPTVIFKENSRDRGIPFPTYAYVKQWNGTSFVLLGDSLNVNKGSTVADSVAISGKGPDVYAAFTEYVLTPAAPASVNSSPPQAYLKLWNGSSWSLECGGTANIDRSERAYSISVSVLAGIPYVAFTERTDAGAARLYVRKCEHGKWSTVGGRALNRNPDRGWAFRPELVMDGTSLYIAWDEQSDFGYCDRIYVAQLQEDRWVNLGGALNDDTNSGSATHPSIAVFRGSPVVSWGEVKKGGMRQMYAKRWNGSDWVSGDSR